MNGRRRKIRWKWWADGTDCGSGRRKKSVKEWRDRYGEYDGGPEM
jgi:hypothetical protein